MSQLDFHGAVAVVTGGANGIGFAAASRFADCGAHVVVADVDGDAASLAARALEDRFGRAATGVRHDVRSDEDAADLAELATGLGPIRGVSAGGRLEYVPIAEWQRLFNVNVLGVVRGLTAFLPGLIAQHSPSHVVITGSPDHRRASSAAIRAWTLACRIQARTSRPRSCVPVLPGDQRRHGPTPRPSHDGYGFPAKFGGVGRSG